MATIVDRIKDLSKARNMSIYDLEDKMEFGRNTIYQWNKRNPSIDRVKKVANFFNVSVDYLVGEDKNSPDTPEFRAIQRGAKKLSREDQERLLGMMNAAFKKIDNKTFKEGKSDDSL